MSLDTIDLSMPMNISERLDHGVSCSNIFRVVPMLMQQFLTSSLALSLVPSVTKASGTPVYLANKFKDNRASDYFFIRQTCT